MDQLLKEIEAALNAGLRIMPLQSVLALPDICGAVEHGDNRANKSRYIAWYKKWVEDKYRWESHHPVVKDIAAGKMDISKAPFSYRGDHLVTLPADECYRFRCAMLHQGKALHDQSKYHRIIYVISCVDKDTIEIHNSIAEDKNNNHGLFLDIPRFCRDIITSVESWLQSKNQNSIVQKNLEAMVQERKNATTPFGVCNVVT